MQDEGPPLPAGGPQQPMPTAFLTKTYQLVDDPSWDDVISWADGGSTFVVWRPAEFARDLLPKYFKHDNFSSFVRQLNTYGFRKITPDRWEFANECFRRGEQQLLREIQRRKIAPAAVPPTTAWPPANPGDEPAVSSSGSGTSTSPATHAGAGPVELKDENERLRRENAELSREVGQMKGFCDSILLVMSEYAAHRQLGSGGAAERGGVEGPPSLAVSRQRSETPARRSTEALFPGADLDEAVGTSKRLFGVPMKRWREEEGEVAAPQAKSVPFDSGGGRAC